jgi:hypothetical protein
MQGFNPSLLSIYGFSILCKSTHMYWAWNQLALV